MGKCPVCDHCVAPSCQTCPKCGNTEWFRKTGEIGESEAIILCKNCPSSDSNHRAYYTGGQDEIDKLNKLRITEWNMPDHQNCEKCNRKGTIKAKVRWFEWTDTRNNTKWRTDTENWHKTITIVLKWL